MDSGRVVPIDPIPLIRFCVSQGKLFWTHHVEMRLEKRSINRDAIVRAIETCELVESYPDDKYLPSYLTRIAAEDEVLHVLFAVDVADANVRVVTAYRPDPAEWDAEFRKRRKA